MMKMISWRSSKSTVRRRRQGGSEVRGTVDTGTWTLIAMLEGTRRSGKSVVDGNTYMGKARGLGLPRAYLK